MDFPRTGQRHLDNQIPALYNNDEVVGMNNEEKIIEMLQAMQADIQVLKAGQAKLETELSASESRMMVLMESYFEPKFNLLADGQALIRETMLPAEAMNTAEDRLDVLEAAVKLHSREIEKLKKAQ